MRLQSVLQWLQSSVVEHPVEAGIRGSGNGGYIHSIDESVYDLQGRSVVEPIDVLAGKYWLVDRFVP